MSKDAEVLAGIEAGHQVRLIGDNTEYLVVARDNYSPGERLVVWLHHPNASYGGLNFGVQLNRIAAARPDKRSPWYVFGQPAEMTPQEIRAFAERWDQKFAADVDGGGWGTYLPPWNVVGPNCNAVCFEGGNEFKVLREPLQESTTNTAPHTVLADCSKCPINPVRHETPEESALEDANAAKLLESVEEENCSLCYGVGEPGGCPICGQFSKEPACPVCDGPLTEVRPGKHQCDNPECPSKPIPNWTPKLGMAVRPLRDDAETAMIVTTHHHAAERLLVAHEGDLWQPLGCGWCNEKDLRRLFVPVEG